MSTRKRRRQETFEEPEFEQDPALTEEEIAKAREEKEQEIWDAVREAHYEGSSSKLDKQAKFLTSFIAIEQLPLTLQRQLALMRQLDEQSNCEFAISFLHKLSLIYS